MVVRKCRSIYLFENFEMLIHSDHLYRTKTTFQFCEIDKGIFHWLIKQDRWEDFENIIYVQIKLFSVY